MRRSRFLSPSAENHSCLYHCISRVVDRQFVLGREQKDVFVRMMREYEDFCGVRVLSYCIMSNHFHLLVEVPPKKKDEVILLDDGEFLRRLKPLYSKVYYRGIEQMLERFRADGADAAADELKVKFTYRIHDLSHFMKGLKQRFTQWYNGAHGRRGTLWEGRFKSVLVENGYAARVMEAYIDLNPVRAGMVERPEDYRWCSYAEAMGPKATRVREMARSLRLMSFRGLIEGLPSWRQTSLRRFMIITFHSKFGITALLRTALYPNFPGWSALIPQFCRKHHKKKRSTGRSTDQKCSCSGHLTYTMGLAAASSSRIRWSIKPPKSSRKRIRCREASPLTPHESLSGYLTQKANS